MTHPVSDKHTHPGMSVHLTQKGRECTALSCEQSLAGVMPAASAGNVGGGKNTSRWHEGATCSSQTESPVSMQRSCHSASDALASGQGQQDSPTLCLSQGPHLEEPFHTWP